jgi:hypothetical protein
MMTIENIVDVSGESVEAQLAQLNIERQLASDVHQEAVRLRKEAYDEKVFCAGKYEQLLTEQSQILDQWDKVNDASKWRLLGEWDKVTHALRIWRNAMSITDIKDAHAVSHSYETLGPVMQCKYEIAKLTKI